MSTTAARDATNQIANSLAADPLDVQVVTLSRNFGKEAALLAGLDHARLGAVLFMDGDGQHPPDLVETLVARWLDDGYDVVYTAKAHRENEPWLRRTGVHWFYALINLGARQKIPEDAGDFRLLSPRAAAALRQMPERNRFFKGLSSWIGFRQVRVDYEPAARAHGATTWNVWTPDRPVDRGADLVHGGAAARRQPARPAAGGDRAVVRRLDPDARPLLFGQDVPGYPSLVVGLMVLGGVQLSDDRRARRIYRQAAVRDQSAAGLFRRRTQREERGRIRQRAGEAAAGGLARGGVSANVPTAGRQIWLCADDYGISRSVNAAIRELILRGRINATSVMTAAPHFDADEADALDAAQFRREARRARPARHADRAVQADERRLRAAAPRPFPAAQRK